MISEFEEDAGRHTYSKIPLKPVLRGGVQKKTKPARNQSLVGILLAIQTTSEQLGTRGAQPLPTTRLYTLRYLREGEGRFGGRVYRLLDEKEFVS